MYKSFLPDTSETLKPLYELLKGKQTFNWTAERQEAFIKSKKLLLSNKVLVHYNPKLPLVLSTDASPYGISAGAVSVRCCRFAQPPVSNVIMTF